MEEDIQPSLGRGMTAMTDGAEGGTIRTDAMEECQHSRGGVCHLHGPGASLHWRPARRTGRGRGRGGSNGYRREYYYSCDLGPRGRGRLRQSSLSFARTTNDDNNRDNTTSDDFTSTTHTGGNMG